MTSSRGSHDQLLFVGTHGHVLAIDKNDGSKVWDRSLPRTGYSVVSVVFEDGKLFCASGGRVFALDAMDGRILWSNNLPGMGQGLVYLTTANSNDTEAVMNLLAAQEAKKQEQHAPTS